MQPPSEYELLLERMLASRIDSAGDHDAQGQFRAAVHKIPARGCRKSMTTGDLLAQLNFGIAFNPLIDLLRVRLFGVVPRV